MKRSLESSLFREEMMDSWWVSSSIESADSDSRRKIWNSSPGLYATGTLSAVVETEGGTKDNVYQF